MPIFMSLHFQSSYSSSDGGSYSGTLAYRDGTLRYGNYAPLPHNLDAKFDATRDALKVAPATLSVGPSQVELVATLRDYSNPSIQANYRANLDGEEFRRELKNPNIPSGMILLTGTAQYQNRPNTAVLNSLSPGWTDEQHHSSRQYLWLPRDCSRSERALLARQWKCRSAGSARQIARRNVQRCAEHTRSRRENAVAARRIASRYLSWPISSHYLRPTHCRRFD